MERHIILGSMPEKLSRRKQPQRQSSVSTTTKVLIAGFCVLAGAYSLPARAASGPEFHISSSGDVHIIGAEIIRRHALNLFTVDVWGQRWTVPIDMFTKVEVADGTAAALDQFALGHKLEIRGRPGAQLGWLDAKIVRNLSVGTPPPTAPQVAAIAQAVAPPPPPPASPPKPSAPAPQKPPPIKPPSRPAPERLTQNLKLGTRGPEVALLQEFLQKNAWGIPDDGPVTGYYGAVTVAAVKKFQAANNLPPEGELGPKTRALINEFLKNAKRR